MHADPSNTLTILSIPVEPLQLALAQRIHQENLHVVNAQVSLMKELEYDLHCMTLQLRATLAKSMYPEQPITQRSVWVPHDWWQALKERWAPEWVLRRWPVARREIPVEYHTYRVCPHLEMPIDRARHVMYLAQREGKYDAD